jgi:hypothetical protein
MPGSQPIRSQAVCDLSWSVSDDTPSRAYKLRCSRAQMMYVSSGTSRLYPMSPHTSKIYPFLVEPSVEDERAAGNDSARGQKASQNHFISQKSAPGAPRLGCVKDLLNLVTRRGSLVRRSEPRDFIRHVRFATNARWCAQDSALYTPLDSELNGPKEGSIDWILKQ